MSVGREGIPLTLYSNLISLHNADIELYPSCYKRMLSKNNVKHLYLQVTDIEKRGKA